MYCHVDVDMVYSRGGLSVNTTVSTVYFAKNANSMYEVRSVATENVLPLVAVNASNQTDLSNCYINKMVVSTMHAGWEETSFDGYTFSAVNGKGFIEVLIE